MKKIIFLFALIISLAAAAQKDSTIQQPNDSTGLAQYRDYQLFNQKIVSELPAKYADAIRGFWNEVFQYRAQEFINRQKPVLTKGKPK